jgi:hypothetical protein
MPPMTLSELKEKLKDLDEVTLIELLGITSEQIVEYFTLEIEDNLEKLERAIDDFE